MPNELQQASTLTWQMTEQPSQPQSRTTIPARLEAGCDANPPPPPIKTNRSELPIDHLRWDDLERLCLRLARTRDEISECRLYGKPGDAQHGIDLYARLADLQKWRVYQCKHVQEITPSVLASIFKKFLGGDFADVSDEFVLCTNQSLRPAKLDDAWRDEADKLQARGIKATRWDAEEIVALLLDQPRLVFDFFGPIWFEAFFGQPPREFAKRLEAGQVKLFRAKCRHFYDSRVDRLDPGLPLGHREESVRLPLKKRFVSPDILVRLGPAMTSVEAEDQQDAQNSALETTELVTKTGSAARTRSKAPRSSPPPPTRMPAQTWIGRTPRQVLLGEPGIGKSTVLRFLASDLLADEPNWTQTTRAWGEMLPVWVPFPYWTAQISAHHGTGITLPDLLRRWLELEHQKELIPLVDKALEDDRLLLLVDGLDEYHDESAAGVALQQLLSFLDVHPVPTLMVSRPLGFAPLRGALSNWAIAEVASLSNEQQDQLASLWFRADAVRHDYPAEEVDAVTHQRMQDFRQQLESARELGELAGVPLLLGLMVRLNLDGAHLPSSRREACEQLAALLLDEHPRRRRVAAQYAGNVADSVASKHRISSRNKRRAFAALALTAFQERPTGTVEETAAVRWLAEFLSSDEDSICMDRAAAHTAAREFVTEAQSELGLLVETANGQFGFFHRLIQEWLASERLRELPLVQQREIVRGHAIHPQWREILLSFFQTLSPEALETFLVDLEALRQQATRNQLDEIELVLAATVFGDTQMNGKRRRELMERSFRLIERSDDMDLRERLLKTALASLAGQNHLASSAVQSRVEDWFPARRTRREDMLRFIGEWPRDPAVVDVLLANLHDDHIENVRAAAAGIGKQARDDADTVEHLCTLAHSSESSLCRAGALEALQLCLPATDPRLAEIARLNRDCGAPEVEMMSIKVLIALGEQTPADRRRLLQAGRWLIAPELHREWHLELARVLAAGWPGDSVVRSTAIRSLRSEHFESGRLEPELAILVLLGGFPMDERAATALIEHLGSKNIGLYLALNRRAQLVAELAPAWRGHDKLIPAIETWLEDKKIRGYGNLEMYHFLKTKTMKEKLIGCLRNETTLHGLELHALMQVWGTEDPDVLSACQYYVNHTAKGYLHAQEYLPALVADPAKARQFLIERLRSDTGIELHQVLVGLRALDGNLSSPDIVDRCFDVLADDKPLWDDCLEHNLIAYGFPNPRVKAIVLKSIDQRENYLNLLAKSWAADPDIRPKILKNTTVLPARLRYTVVDSLERLPRTETWPDDVLAAYDSDTEVGVRCAAAAALAQRQRRHGLLNASIIAKFVDSLTADGPNKPERRLAGLAGLLALERYGEIITFVEGDVFRHEMTTNLMLLSEAQPLLRLLAGKWEGLSGALNEIQLKQLVTAVDPGDHLLYQSDDVIAGTSFAKWLYEQHLAARSPDSPGRHSLEELARAYPGSTRLRQLCLELLRSEAGHESKPDWWIVDRAAHLLARHFGNDEATREELVRDREVPSWGGGTVQALARGWPDSEHLARWANWVSGKKVGLHWSTFWSCTFAFSPANVLIGRLRRLGARMNHHSTAAFREQSGILSARLARHSDLSQEIAEEIMTTESPAIRMTWLTLLGNSGLKCEPFQRWLEQRCEGLARETNLPTRFGVDYSTDSVRNESQTIAAVLSGKQLG